MTDTPLVTFTLSLPVETYHRLAAFTKATNAQFDNAASRCINAGIDASVERWPDTLGKRLEMALREAQP